MPAVPRLRDSVTIVRRGADCFSVRVRQEGEELSLSPSGYDLLARMDGVSDLEEVRQAFEQRWETGLSREELTSWIDELERSGAFVRDSSSIAALSHLHSQGVRFRGARIDRREVTRDADRRGGDSPRAQWFDYGVFLLNEGRVEESFDTFLRIAEEDPADVRVRELSRHLQNLISGSIGEAGERRDVTWETFDSTLLEFLAAGGCPTCGESIDIEIGDLNRCQDCGASFSSFVLQQARDERRQS